MGHIIDCRYFNLSGAHALLATVNGPGVVAAFTLASLPPEKGLRVCANLAGLIPSGATDVLRLRAVQQPWCCDGRHLEASVWSVLQPYCFMRLFERLI